jgi:predicted ATP-binding protein involved in virulence
LLIDEVEAHLHPRWQRAIVPSLLSVVDELARDLVAQIHLATHSPLVLASAEPRFQEDRDKLLHLRLDGKNVVLEELPFAKRGRADLWLMSQAFDLDQPRSVPASEAIEAAKRLQEADSPSTKDVRQIHQKLTAHLAPDDEFWPLWSFFAKKHGVRL